MNLYCCVCVLELGGVVDDRHSMHEVVIIHYNDDDGSTLIFVRRTYEIGVVLALVEQYVRLGPILLVFDTYYW